MSFIFGNNSTTVCISRITAILLWMLFGDPMPVPRLVHMESVDHCTFASNGITHGGCNDRGFSVGIAHTQNAENHCCDNDSTFAGTASLLALSSELANHVHAGATLQLFPLPAKDCQQRKQTNSRNQQKQCRGFKFVFQLLVHLKVLS